MSEDHRIYHITTQKAWDQACSEGDYRADSLVSQGFIHCSRRDQALRVGNAFYKETPDLVLLHSDPTRLSAELRYDPPDHPSGTPPSTGEEERFPHLYGALNLEAVIAVTPMHLNDAGDYDERIFG